MELTRNCIGSAFLAVTFLLPNAAVFAADHRVEVLNEPAPADVVGPKIASVLAPQGIRVVRGKSRIVCEIWLCKEWRVDSLKAGDQFLYPFRQGQLVGLARFPRKGGEFRDQDVAEGVYTLRYAQMPVDGAHVGVSPTRDFLLLVTIADEDSIDDIAYDDLTTASADAVGSSHPGLLSMKKVTDDGKKAPSIRHDEENDWWIARLQGIAKAGDKSMDLAFDLVVVGFSEE
jgi:hypothetical protein